MTPDLAPGIEAGVVLPPRRKSTRMRLHRVEPDGSLTFIHPRNGGLRTVTPEAVRKVYEPKVGEN